MPELYALLIGIDHYFGYPLNDMLYYPKLSARARPAANETVVVVLPVPPFCEAIAMILIIQRRGATKKAK